MTPSFLFYTSSRKEPLSSPLIFSRLVLLLFQALYLFARVPWGQSQGGRGGRGGEDLQKGEGLLNREKEEEPAASRLSFAVPISTHSLHSAQRLVDAVIQQLNALSPSCLKLLRLVTRNLLSSRRLPTFSKQRARYDSPSEEDPVRGTGCLQEGLEVEPMRGALSRTTPSEPPRWDREKERDLHR